MSGSEYDPFLDVFETLWRYKKKVKQGRTTVSVTAMEFSRSPVITLTARRFHPQRRMRSEEIIFLDELRDCKIPPQEYVRNKLHDIVEDVK